MIYKWEGPGRIKDVAVADGTRILPVRSGVVCVSVIAYLTKQPFPSRKQAKKTKKKTPQSSGDGDVLVCFLMMAGIPSIDVHLVPCM